MFVIYRLISFDGLIAIIKERPPRAYPHLENVVIEQAPEEHGAVNSQDQVLNDDMDEDDHDDNVVEDDGTNTLIHDAFNVRMDDDDHEIDDFDDVHDIPLLEKAYKPLYKGSNITLISAVMLIMNLKVVNGYSNRSITLMLRYVIYFIDHTHIYMVKINSLYYI
jgi:hypothetical protein